MNWHTAIINQTTTKPFSFRTVKVTKQISHESRVKLSHCTANNKKAYKYQPAYWKPKNKTKTITNLLNHAARFNEEN